MEDDTFWHQLYLREYGSPDSSSKQPSLGWKQAYRQAGQLWDENYIDPAFELNDTRRQVHRIKKNGLWPKVLFNFTLFMYLMNQY